MKTLLGMVLLAAAAFAAAGGSEEEVRKAEAAWALAVQGRDLAALDRIYDDALIYAHSTGVVETKAEYMKRLSGGLQRYSAVRFESTRVSVHGETAVTVSRLRMSGQSNERQFDDHLMMMHVWVRKGGVWRLTAHQTTKLAE
ncbi:MAG: nuclear transport factor 2 family protein [Acidobacteria bacterium]|nr:nuclear transport factor 2 family protein [Acidobacteriota bacterium]